MHYFQSSIRRANLTHAQQQRMLTENRRKENLREDQLKRIGQEKVLEANLASEERIESRRFLRKLQQEEQERQTNEAIIKNEERQQLKEQQQEQEIRLARELENIKLEAQKDEKLRQHIRENSVEIQELQAKLKAGYMNRERAAQLAEREVMELADKKKEDEINRKMEVEYKRALVVEREKEKQRWGESVRYQNELEKQLTEKEKRKQVAYEEFLKEKLMIDEIVRKIYEEDQREISDRLEKQRATQRYIEEFKTKRNEWKHREQALMEEENRRIIEFAHLQQEREEQRMEKQKQQEEEMATVQKALADKIWKNQEERDEMERIRLELHMEEQEEFERQKEMMEIENKIRQRLDLQLTRRQQLEFKEQRLQAEKDEEEEFRRKTTVCMNIKAVERLIEDRRMQNQKGRETELQARQEEERMQSFRKEIIEQERQRLLREHAAKLLGFLPKGVLRDSRDLELFDDDFRTAYKARHVNLFDELTSESSQ
ncbi:hypothetical protein QZH41_015857 [Actinostola sp. cb2023]|nr:hypothetical protein QZH41_015857 [Actinostola sp. cb2023]